MAPFTVTLPTGFTLGTYITATATNSGGETTDFSNGYVGTLITFLTIAATASPSSVSAGQVATDIFTIANPSTTTGDAGVAFSDPIPAGTTFVSGMTSTGVPVKVAGGIATAAIGALAAGQSVTVSIVLMTSTAAEPSFTSTAQVTATSPNVTAGVVTASATTTIIPTADLVVAVSSPTTTTATGRLTFTASVSNSDPDPASGAILTDTFTLPPGARLAAESITSGTLQITGNTVTAAIGTLSVGSTVTLTVSVVTTAGGSFVQSSAASSSTLDPVSANNSASNTATILGLDRVTLIPSASLVIINKPLTLNAQVIVPAGFPVATRSVTFFDGTTPIGTAMLDASGHASIVVASLAKGLHALSASYTGDTNEAPSLSTTASVRINPPAVGDYDGDGKSDVAIYDQTTSIFYILKSGGGTIVQSFGNATHLNIPVPGDYDDDGKTDLAIYDQTASIFYILKSGGGSIVQPFGNPAHINIPIAGDYEGDGKTDLAIYDQTASIFYILKSGGGSIVQPFGNPTHVNIAVAGDYDGDSKTDLAIYDQTASIFYILKSGGGLIVQPFGNPAHTNVPLAGDYDDDNKTDLAIDDTTSSTFYVLESGGGSLVQPFGNPADQNIPLAVDLDGDGKADLVVYDDTAAIFYVQHSGGGSLASPFGSKGHANKPV